MAEYKWNKYQKDIFNAVMGTKGNIAINSTAGSGKTTVLVEISRLLPVSSKSIFLAFNKTISLELADRLPNKFETSTLHSLGLNILKRSFGNNTILSPSKVWNMANKMMLSNKSITNIKERNSRLFYVTKGYDHLRNSMINIDNEDEVADMLSRFSLESNYGYEDLKSLDFLMNKYNSSRKRGEKFEIDFTDMIYLPATLQKLKYPKYDNILVDEVQDLNVSQSTLISKIRSKSSRLIVVGDKFQSIYLFAGSSLSVFNSFKDAPNTESFPLSVSYRCPINVVLEAQKYSPDIMYAPSAEYGFVGDGDLDMVDEGDAVLCRNNSPLFEAYLGLLGEGKKAYIVGKEVAERFKVLMKPYRNSHIGALIDGLRIQLEQIEDVLLAKGIKKPTQHPKYQSFLDIARSLSLIAESCSNMRELDKCIEEIFHPQKDAVILSSIHKSKGLEYDRVFLLRPDLLPSKFAKSSEEMQQENNLMFVAITRAKKQFFYIRKDEE